MTDLRSIIRIQTWLSPAFPTGAFSYSHGLETSIAKGWVCDRESLSGWLVELLTDGPGWNDAVLLAESWRLAFSDEDAGSVSELATALTFSSERQLETLAQGTAFLTAAKAWGPLPDLPDECALPVAVGTVAGHFNIELQHILVAYLQAYVSNQIQAALRLMTLGQQGGVDILSSLETPIIKTAVHASKSSLDDLGSNTFLADVAAMQHETQESRIFRS